ncbi:hypothetical protein ACP70R_034475 [Stipagrostis hirtigluma subsp. patula]
MENRTSNPQPPTGYPTAGSEQQGQQGAGGGTVKKKKRGEGFIEWCLAALCCVWLCDLCCD